MGMYQMDETLSKWNQFSSCFPVGYREISVKILFDLTLVAPVKIPIYPVTSGFT